MDHSATGFDAILNIDPEFGKAWVDWRYDNARDRYLSEHSEHRDYTRLWLRPDFMTTMRAILGRIRIHAKGAYFYHGYGEVFMRVTDRNPNNAEITKRQFDLLSAWIAEHADDTDEMKFVFSLVGRFKPQQRKDLLQVFLARNTKYEDFKRLPLESNLQSWSGSDVGSLKDVTVFL